MLICFDINATGKTIHFVTKFPLYSANASKVKRGNFGNLTFNDYNFRLQ